MPGFELLIKQRFRRQNLVCKAKINSCSQCANPLVMLAGERAMPLLWFLPTSRGDRLPSSGWVMVCAAEVALLPARSSCWQAL